MVTFMAVATMRLAVFMVAFMVVADCADPDPLQDLCVADLTRKNDFVNGYMCKETHNVTVEDFIYCGIRKPGNATETGFFGTSVNVVTFPGLNTLGMSVVRADFMPGGVNVPHLHPRATEIGHVIEGTLYSGFVTTDNKVHAKIITKGDVMVFPRGLVHFQMNVGKINAVIVGTLNSQNPGLVKLPNTLFGSGINDAVLQKAFKLSKKQVRNLKGMFGSP